MAQITDFLSSTMLLERLAGVGLYVLVLGYYYNKVKYAEYKQIPKYLNHYLIILCIMAFLYIPGTSADLYRWRELADPWKYTSLSWFWEKRIIPSRTPLGYLLIYTCQMTGVDGLLPMVCAFGFFGSFFHILKCEIRREGRSQESIAIAMLFIMCSGVFLEVISGIRCLLSFAIALRCVYDELFEKKGFIKHIPFYIIASLLHNAALPLVGIRLMCMLFEKKRNLILTEINILSVVVITYLTITLGDDYIDSAFAKANLYTSKNIYTNIWEYAISTLGLLTLLWILWKYKKRYCDQWQNDMIGLRYILLTLAGDICFIRTYTIFHRYCIAALIISIPVLLSFLDVEGEIELYKSRKILVVISLLILCVACVRGNLSGYKFFLLD